MSRGQPLEVRIATSESDLLGAQRLRYQVFVKEFQAQGGGIDHERKIETDQFDSFVDNLVLVDSQRDEQLGEHVVGVYRLMTSQAAAEGVGFYSQSEFNLMPLIKSGRSLVELGRSCVHPDYRGGMSMFLLFNGVADYVLDKQIEIMFGVASFHGTESDKLINTLSFLNCEHLAPKALRVQAHKQTDVPPLQLLPCEQVDRIAATKDIPPLIKSYLRLGGVVGDGVYFDYEFNSTDIFLLVDTLNMSEDRERRYRKYRGKF